MGLTKKLQEKERILIMGILLAIMCLITYIFAIHVEIVAPYWHSFYIPIIFASLWWKRKGLAVAVFSILLLYVDYWLAGLPFFSIDNFARAGTFVLVAYVVGMVSERQARGEEKLQQAHEVLQAEIAQCKQMEHQIEEQREYLSAVLRDAPDAIVSLDSSHRIVEWNSGAERLYGYTLDEARGNDPSELLTRPNPEMAKGIVLNIDWMLSGEKLPPTEVVRYHKDGTPKNVILAGSPIIIKQELRGAVVTYTDITERKRAEKALEEAKWKIESLHEIARHLESCKTIDNVYQLTVEAAERILGFSICTLDIVEEGQLVVKATSSGLLPPNTSVRRPLTEGLAAKTYRSGETIVFSSMDEVPEATPTSADFKSGISAPIGDIGVFQAVSTQTAAFSKDDVLLLKLLLGHTVEAVKRIRLQNELREQAIRDPLTGVYNRRYFTQAFAQEVARSTRYDRPITFLVIDVNRFKEINDRFGHQTGDRVLQVIADILQEQVRESDTVIRYGGDEFLIILPETDGGVEAVKERITAAVTHRNETNRLIDFPVTLSIGSAVWPPSGAKSVDKILAEADSRMYEAKREHG